MKASYTGIQPNDCIYIHRWKYPFIPNWILKNRIMCSPQFDFYRKMGNVFYLTRELPETIGTTRGKSPSCLYRLYLLDKNYWQQRPNDQQQGKHWQLQSATMTTAVLYLPFTLTTLCCPYYIFLHVFKAREEFFFNVLNCVYNMGGVIKKLLRA